MAAMDLRIDQHNRAKYHLTLLFSRFSTNRYLFPPFNAASCKGLRHDAHNFLRSARWIGILSRFGLYTAASTF